MNINLESDGSYSIAAKVGTVLLDPKDVHLGDSLPESTVVVFSDSLSLFGREMKASTWLHGPGEYELSSIRVAGMGYAAPKKTKIIYLIEADGFSMCSLGTLEAVPDSKAMGIFEKVDVALVDVQNMESDSISAGEVAGVLQSLEPSTIILNGWDSGTQAPSAKLREILAALGANNAEPQTKITIGSKGKSDGETIRQVRVLTL